MINFFPPSSVVTIPYSVVRVGFWGPSMPVCFAGYIMGNQLTAFIFLHPSAVPLTPHFTIS